LKKIAIFVEGLTEFLLFKHILSIISNSSVSYKVFELYKGDLRQSEYNYDCPGAKVEFLIVKANNDEKVVSAIRDRAEGFIEQGYAYILGLRDMYSEEYKKASKKRFSEEIINKFINGTDSVIRNMSCHDKIKIFFAVMEVEAWFLSMWEIFEKIDRRFTYDYIKTKLDSGTILDCRVYYKPSIEVKKIIRDYDKSRGEIYKIVNKITEDDLNKVVLENRCKEYKDFINEIKTLIA
jgi:hypothetical protein